MARRTGGGTKGARPPTPRTLVVLALVLGAAGPLRAEGEGTSWRYRDEHGRVFFTDNPESIPARYRSSAVSIKPVDRNEGRSDPSRDPASPPASTGAPIAEAEKALRDALPAGGSDATRSSNFPFAAVSVVGAEALLVRVAARLTGLYIGLPAVAVACCVAVFVHQLHVPVLSSLGSFLVLFVLLWKLGRADNPETVALFLVVTALLHVTALYALVKLPTA